MRSEPVGDSLLIVREFEGEAAELSRWISTGGVAGVVETVPSYETVGVVVDPMGFDEAGLESRLREWSGGRAARCGELRELPVCFELGEDLMEVCGRLGLGREAFLDAFCGMELVCRAVGFSPGFPYFGYLPKGLAGLERRETPRTRVPEGSVAIVGRQAGVYPEETPGGWWIVGRTPVRLVDRGRRWTLFRAGDRVRFVGISQEAFEGYEAS